MNPEFGHAYIARAEVYDRQGRKALGLRAETIADLEHCLELDISADIRQLVEAPLVSLGAG